MLCDECHKRPVKVHITRIINGQKTKLNLCEECAQKYQKFFTPGPGFGQSFSITKFLAGLLDDELEGGVSLETQQELKCPKCGLSYADFSVHGRLGCGECYNTFRSRIDPLLEKIHGSNTHYGKVPNRINIFNVGTAEEDRTGNDRTDNKLRELDRLRSRLQFLVDRERFEEAATVRDKIRELEAQIEGTS